MREEREHETQAGLISLGLEYISVSPKAFWGWDEYIYEQLPKLLVNSSVKKSLWGGGLSLYRVFAQCCHPFRGYRFWGAPYRFTRVLLMSLNFISACFWLLHDNKSSRSYGLLGTM